MSQTLIADASVTFTTLQEYQNFQNIVNNAINAGRNITNLTADQSTLKITFHIESTDGV